MTKDCNKPLDSTGSHAKALQRKKPGPRSRLSKADKQAIAQRYLSGDTAAEIAHDYPVGKRYIRTLVAKQALKQQLEQRRLSIPNLEQQIARLTSRKNPTESVCQRIAMLS